MAFNPTPERRDTNASCFGVKGRMIRLFSAILLLSLPNILPAQYGIQIKHLFGQSLILDEEQISQNGLHTTLEYHFRIKKKRLEFHPGLGYRFTWNTHQHQGYFNAVDLDLATSIYPFDFGGDCDCPTFSKDGNLIKKGFFFEVAPGVSYQILNKLRSDPDDPSRLPIRSKNLVLKLSGATGLDIGISDQYTITPMLSATWLSSSEWEGLRQDGSSGTLDDYAYLGAGIRITHAKDKKRRRRF